MYVMQATFRTKPGKAQALIDKLTAATERLGDAGSIGHRILVDHIADFWTVIFEAEFENLDDYFAAISAPEVRAAMEGYLDLVQGGHRRVYRVASAG